MNRYDYEELHADEPEHRLRWKRWRSACDDRQWLDDEWRRYMQDECGDGMCGDVDNCPRCGGIPEDEDV